MLPSRHRSVLNRLKIPITLKSKQQSALKALIQRGDSQLASRYTTLCCKMIKKNEPSTLSCAFSPVDLGSLSHTPICPSDAWGNGLGEANSDCYCSITYARGGPSLGKFNAWCPQQRGCFKWPMLVFYTTAPE